jgi:predicted TIM-barrel fold metal-dependent hydrolase
MRAVQCALTTISPDKLLFGTDYPYNFTHDPQGVRKYIEDIRRLSLPVMAIDGMLGNNAAKLLGL